MKKHLTFATVLVLMVVLISPFSVSAKTKAGVKSGSFFYFFDKVFEKADLFFTFNPEKKIRKALDNAEERLAEAEESAGENNQEAVETAMKDYQENISLAEMEAKAIEDETKTKDLLSTIASSTSKYQEILTEVLNKVPEQAKEAIEKAIEASKKGVEKADEKNTELKKEVSEIKPEVEETKNELKEKENEEKAEIKDDKKDEQSKEIDKLKKEVEALKQKQTQVKIIEKIIEKEKPITIEKKESSSSQIKQKEVTLPNGAVVEMDEDGNVVRTIKEALQEIYTPTTESSSQNISASYPYAQIEIMSVKTIPSFNSVNFEWNTNIPTDAKVFVSSFGVSTLVSQSSSGNSTHHIATVSSLKANTSYTFEIETISKALIKKYTGSFKTTSMKSITIISPIKSKGLGRTYLSRQNIKDEFNGIELGLIVRDDSGKPVDNAVVTITATDSNQNKILNGTGDITPIYENNVKIKTPYYHFSYAFRTPGNHTITFTAEGLTESVTLSATEDTRK